MKTFEMLIIAGLFVTAVASSGGILVVANAANAFLNRVMTGCVVAIFVGWCLMFSGLVIYPQ
jgi:hypothetical protein